MCMPVMLASGNRESDEGSPSLFAGSNPALHPCKDVCQWIGSRQRRQRNVLSGTDENSIRYPAKNDEYLRSQGISGNVDPALSESGYRARDQKAGKVLLRRLDPRTEGFSRRVGMDNDSRI